MLNYCLTKVSFVYSALHMEYSVSYNLSLE